MGTCGHTTHDDVSYTISSVAILAQAFWLACYFWRIHAIVYASDASLSGYGVCERSLPVDDVRLFGREADKWRYDTESFVNARMTTK